MNTPSFQSVPVVFRGRPAYVQARLVTTEQGHRVQANSLSFADDQSDRGRAVEHAYLGIPPGGLEPSVFGSLDAEEYGQLMDQIALALK